MVGVGISWIPIIKNMQGGQLYMYIQSVAAYLAPPIACVYILAIFFKKTNEKVNIFLKLTMINIEYMIPFAINRELF